MFLPLCQVGLLAGLGVSFRRRSVLAGWLTMAVTDYLLCLALNTYTLAGALLLGLARRLTAPKALKPPRH